MARRKSTLSALVVAVVASVDVTDELAVVASVVATGVEPTVPAEAVAVVVSALVTVVGRSASRCPRARGTATVGDRDLRAGDVPNLSQREVHARRQAQLERLERARDLCRVGLGAGRVDEDRGRHVGLLRLPDPLAGGLGPRDLGDDVPGELAERAIAVEEICGA